VIPGGLAWQNVPVAWHVEHGSELSIRSGKGTDWFVDPFDGAVHSTAPILLFVPADDYILSAKVKVSFNAKWDAGALMVWADDHHWAKLSFELSPAKQPTMVTVVTRVCRTTATRWPSLAAQSISRLPRASRRTFSISRLTEGAGRY
jgi:hypothetical protein